MFNNILDHPKTTVTGLPDCNRDSRRSSVPTGNHPRQCRNRHRCRAGRRLATALLGLLAKDPGSGGSNTGNKLGVFLLVCLLAFSVGARGQVAAEATASAINYQGAWTAGTEQSQSFPLVYWGAQKGNIFSLGAREILNPGVFNVYGALGSYQPDISKTAGEDDFQPRPGKSEPRCCRRSCDPPKRQHRTGARGPAQPESCHHTEHRIHRRLCRRWLDWQGSIRRRQRRFCLRSVQAQNQPEPRQAAVQQEVRTQA